ncbi:MAG: cytidine deaminase [Alistipes sp.]|nr:cytidine deaminase [Alistipes sp.]
MKTLHFDFEYIEAPWESLPSDDRELVAQARQACGTAYAPYSGFRVGAAARLASGQILTASNQESEVFPSGICAERALLYYLQAHHANDPLLAFAVASDPSPRICTPCGACRQVLLDCEKRQAKPFRILLYGDGRVACIASAAHLLPLSFTFDPVK